MKIRFSFKIFVAFILSLLLTSLVGAELPPGAYDELKSQASEHIKIKILTVETEENDEICIINVIYQAEVTKVYRSVSGLQVDDKITIHSYDREGTPSCTNGWGGPQVPELLNVGWVGEAYLNHSEDVTGEYDIAAYGQSFEEEDGSNDDDGLKFGCLINTLTY